MREGKQAPEPGSPIADPIFADAAEEAVVILASGHREAAYTLDEAVRYVTGLKPEDKAGARIRTNGGTVYGIFEIDRLHRAKPAHGARIVTDPARRVEPNP